MSFSITFVKIDLSGFARKLLNLFVFCQLVLLCINAKLRVADRNVYSMPSIECTCGGL